MKKHNIAQILASVSGTTFAGIDQLTALKVNKTIPNPDYVEGSGDPKRVANPHFEHISKLTMGSSVAVGASYENMVKKKLIKEGKDPLDFVAGSLPWGTRIGNTPLIEHKGQVYIQMIFMKGGDTVYRHGATVIEESDIQGYTKPKPKAESQGELEDKVEIRTLKLDSIVKLRINKQEYVGSFYYEEV